MARQRDYRAEYRARLERAEARGLSRKEGRGHAGDILKRTAPTAHASPIYTTEAGARGYVARLGGNRRAKLVAVFEGGGTSVIGGKKGGMSKEAMRRYMAEGLGDFEQQRQRYRTARATAPLAARSAPEAVIGYQILWS